MLVELAHVRGTARLYDVSGSCTKKGRGSSPPLLRRASLLLLSCGLLLEGIHDGRIGEGGGVAQVVLALGDALEDAAHDLAAPRLGQIVDGDDLLGARGRSYLLSHLVPELLHQFLAALVSSFEDHIGKDGLALVFVVLAYDRRLGDGRVRDERALDLRRGDAVPGDVHHVVYPARNGEVAVLVALGAVAGEVDIPVLGPVGLLVAIGILIKRAEHTGPRLLDHEVPGPRALDLVALVVVEASLYPGERKGGATGLRSSDAGQGRDHDPTRLRLPPSVHDRAPATAHVLVVPHPRPRVYRLAHGPQESQGGEVVLLYRLGPDLYERPYGGGCRVQNGDLMLLYDVEPAVVLRIGRRPLKHERRPAVREGAVDEVGVPGDPAHVRRAPVDVVVFEGVNPLVGDLDVGKVAARGVDDPLGFPRRAGRVEDVQHVLRIHLLGGTLRARPICKLVPVTVAPVVHGDLPARACDHDHALDRGRVF